ncbi:MAG: RrF2 family transcriptional regulator [Chloroflexota bacterium]
MRLTSRGDYGLRALIELALVHRVGRPVQVKDIARRQDIPEDYLGQLMVSLRKAGLVESVRGPSGGYVLSRAPEEITLAQALEVLEGPLGQTECSLHDNRARCGMATGCAIQESWSRAARAALDVLESVTIEDLARRQREITRTLSFHI